MSEIPGLKRLRRRIDTLDRQVLTALGRRFEVVRAIGELKRAHGLGTYQKQRWEALMAERLALGAELGLAPAFTEDFFRAVHREALRLQRAPVSRRSRR
jgi:chorismate mutase-like protein